MKSFLKIILIIFLGLISVFGVIRANSNDLLSGYAWSENVGWVSFNCTDEGTCSSSDYGVDFSEADGDMSGYAWSENVGWITFNRGDAGNPPAAPFNDGSESDPIAQVDLDTYELSGWCRALSYGDGWDGWVSLSTTTSDYGIAKSSENQEFEGYAWGDEVIGWLSSNCETDGSCTSSDYAVTLESTPPSISILSPSDNSWQMAAFDVDYIDEDSSGLDNCTYQIYSYNGSSWDSSSVFDRVCGDPDYETVTVPVDDPDGCQYQGEEYCYVYLYAEDVVGNEATENVLLSIDWTEPVPDAPYITESDPDPVEVTAGNTYTIKSDVTDNLDIGACGFYFDSEWQSDEEVDVSGCTTSCTATVEHEFDEPGTYYNNFFRCRDVAGNISSNESKTTFEVGQATSTYISDLTSFSAHCDTPNTECTDQINCCIQYTTQDGCCVKFDVTAYDPEGNTISYEWDFDEDGITDSTSEDPHHHYNTAATYTVSVTASSDSGSDTETIDVKVKDPTLSVDLEVDPSFSSDPIENADLIDTISGTMFGTINYRFDCLNDGAWDLEALNQSVETYTATDTCDYSTSSTAKTEIDRGSSSAEDTRDVTIAGSCSSGATTTCSSSHGCEYEIECQDDSTWPDCPTDDCEAGTTQSCGDGGEQTCQEDCTWGECSDEGCSSDYDCYCSMDGCEGSDYYDYPTYGLCEDGTCNTDTGSGDPCEPTITEDDPDCNNPPVCSSLTADPSVGVGPLDVSLETTATDTDGSIDYYEFTFGDGGITQTVNSSYSHEYEGPGAEAEEGTTTTYTAEAKARDNDGDWSDSATTSIDVTKNHTPVADIGCDASECGTGSSCEPDGTSVAYNGNCVFKFTNESTDDDSTNVDNNDHIAQSTWSIFYEDGTVYDDSYEPYTGDDAMNDFTLPTTQMSAGFYYVKLEVEDEKGATATSTADFEIRDDVVAAFDCSLDPDEEERLWKSCDGLNVSEGEIVYFRDLSEPSQTAATTTSHHWTFEKGTPSEITYANKQNTSATFEQGGGTVTLEVTDDIDRTDTTYHDLIITIPLPEWQEIAPIE